MVRADGGPDRVNGTHLVQPLVHRDVYHGARGERRRIVAGDGQRPGLRVRPVVDGDAEAPGFLVVVTRDVPLAEDLALEFRPYGQAQPGGGGRDEHHDVEGQGGEHARLETESG